MKQVKQFIKYTLIFYALVAGMYWIFFRPGHISWGATAGEQQMKMSADELISTNRIVTTRAINIHAPKEKIWPWIAQTGQNRGGFNSYYWLENLFAARMQNADSIVPQWQNPQPGDTVYYGEGEGYERISFVKRNEYYSLGGWTFYLDSVDANNTRLIVRYPSMEVKQSRVTKAYYYCLFEPLHFIMESGMMMGIKKGLKKNKTDVMNTTISKKKAAYNGALVAVAGVFAYSLAVMSYVIIRSSISIYTIMPSSERATILWTNGFSIAYSVVVFSLLMSAPSLLTGAVAGVILRKVMLLFNPQRHFNKAILTGSITALFLLFLLYFLLYILLKERITLQYAETFLFWYVLPAVIFFIAFVISGVKLNNYFNEMENE